MKHELTSCDRVLKKFKYTVTVVHSYSSSTCVYARRKTKYDTLSSLFTSGLIIRSSEPATVIWRLYTQYEIRDYRSWYRLLVFINCTHVTFKSSETFQPQIVEVNSIYFLCVLVIALFACGCSRGWITVISNSAFFVVGTNSTGRRPGLE